MANPTMTLIASNTVGSSGSSQIIFTSIPSTYTDLLLKISARDTSTGQSAYGFSLVFNNDLTTSNYSGRTVVGNGTNASSGTISDYGTTLTYNAGASTANTFSNDELYIPNYAGSTAKSMSIDAVTENNATTIWAQFVAKLYTPTTAISRLDIYASGTFAQYSTFYLYGIKNS